MDTEYFVKQLLNGLAAGSLYALISVGYNLVYGILKLINFAHGDVYMFGTFIALALVWMGVPFFLAALLACISAGLIALIIERVAYRPVRNAPRVVPTISAVGAALVLRNIALRVWGAGSYSFPPVIPSRDIHLGEFSVNTIQVIVLGLALSLMFGLILLSEKTKVGKAMRCVSQDIPMARLVGIPANRIIQLVYFLGAFVGVAGGILFSLYFNVVWIGMGFLGTLKAWVAAIIGGIGNMYGSFLGGLLLGVSEAMIAGYISSGYRDAFSFAIMMVVLIVLPQGLLGRRVAERA
jgi:branched-chain amino acid transport system permease protein